MIKKDTKKSNSTKNSLLKNDLIKDETIKINNNDMKFNVIVGNPPYQDKGGAGGTSDASIFQHFSELATKLSSRYVSLIIPSRWFAGGRENLVGDFRKKMLTSGNIEELTVYTNSKELFDNVEIKGGLCYYLENKEHKGLCKYTIHRDGTTQTKNIKLDKIYREMIAHAFFFYFFSIMAIFSALMVIASRNTVNSVFFLILDFISSLREIIQLMISLIDCSNSISRF